MFRYETHCHTAPVSACAKASPEETVAWYKSAGYDGIFITNHFLDGNIRIDGSVPYDEKIRFYFSDYHIAEKAGREIGLKVFPGVEMSYGGTDFLVYGLDEEWYLKHPEIMEMNRRDMTELIRNPLAKSMNRRDELDYLRSEGAFVVHAHPFREAGYIDHIRLYPRSVDAVEVTNACNGRDSIGIATFYAQYYSLPATAGTDNHRGGGAPAYAGIETDTPIETVQDYRDAVMSGNIRIFFEKRA